MKTSIYNHDLIFRLATPVNKCLKKKNAKKVFLSKGKIEATAEGRNPPRDLNEGLLKHN